MGKLNINEACNIALKCREYLNKSSNALNEVELKKYIDEFIKEHNTCTLDTGYKEFVIATPIEYMYTEDVFYFITEGGLKFNGILQNHNVSIAIYDNYTGMSNLKGLQIQGKAEIIETRK